MYKLEEIWHQVEPKLREDLAHIVEQHTISNEDEAILPLALGAVVQGIDVAERYPRFHQRMLACAELQEMFLDALTLLEEDHTSEPAQLSQAPLPKGPSRETEPLGSILKPFIEKISANRWRAGWQQSLDQLQLIFFPAAAPVSRPEEYSLEDVTLPLLRSQFQAAGVDFDVLLKVIQKVESPQLLYPVAVVAFQSLPHEPLSNPPPLKFHLQWGSYQGDAVLDVQGQANFPPLVRNIVLDESREQVTAFLSFSLETIIP